MATEDASVIHTAAEVLSYVVATFIVTATVWFIAVNYIGSELNHPLDYYSNQLRTKPPVFVLVLVLFYGSAITLVYFGVVQDFRNTIPEIAIATWLQGLLICGNIFIQESAAACLVAIVMYAILAPATVVIVLIPTFPGKRPGVIYSCAFFILNYIWVRWVAESITARAGDNRIKQLLPKGAESVPRLWFDAVAYVNPWLLVVTCVCYLFEFLVGQEQYGYACALCFWILSLGLLIACCKNYKDTRETMQIQPGDDI